MPKNIQTTTQLCSFHMLARLCSKSSKLGCHRIWTENFQIYKLGFKDVEEPEIKLLTFVGLKRKQGNSRKYICFTDYNKALSCVDHNKLWELLRRWEYQNHLTCLLRSLYEGQEATVRTGHETTDWIKIGTGVQKGDIWSPWLFILYEEDIMLNAGLDESKAAIKIPRRKINNLRYADIILKTEN